MNRDAFTQAALDDVTHVLQVLGYVASSGPAAKPTVAQLNDIVRRLDNAKKFLKMALPGKD